MLWWSGWGRNVCEYHSLEARTGCVRFVGFASKHYPSCHADSAVGL